jgi:DNA-binding transcriptional ArsR family regulator
LPEERKLAEIETEVFGNKQRFRIYWFMLTKGDAVGVREVQRGLGISSPSVVSHHLDRLKEAGVVESDAYGRYRLSSKVEIGVLQSFTRVGGFMLPRLGFYAVFLTTALIAYAVLFWGSANVYALAFGMLGAAFTWYEAYRAWRKRPF